jgi:trk system potassium uptake protein TrkH
MEKIRIYLFQNLKKLESIFIQLTFFSIFVFVLRIGFEIPEIFDSFAFVLNQLILLYFLFYTFTKFVVSENKKSFLKRYKLTIYLWIIFISEILISTIFFSSRIFFTQTDNFFLHFFNGIAIFLIALSLLSGQFTFIDFFKSIKLSPTRIFLYSFIAVILLGTFFLMLPKSTVNGISFTDALFTATSATCVTGLVTLDTATEFTRTGQIIILVLIQIGGLGIITISAFFAYVGGQKSNLNHSIIVKELLNADYFSSINRLLLRIVMTTFAIEFVGAFLLWAYWSGFSFDSQTFYEASFHSVSAFCNAGFSTYSDSFMTVHNDFFSLSLISILIILGGLGFTVLTDIRHYFQTKKKFRKQYHFSLHTKIVLRATVFLLVIGFVGFFVTEFFYSMNDVNFFEKLKHAAFQSVVSRTAGFNSVDFSMISIQTTLWFVILMFIGGGSNSTAGGVKVGTIAVLWYWLKSLILKDKQCVIKGRAIRLESFHQAILIFVFAVVYVVFTVILMTFIEDFSFQEILFEVISAFATVGLSMGITSELSFLGKLIISFTMLVGRIGIITFAFSVVRPHKEQLNIKYPEEYVHSG